MINSPDIIEKIKAHLAKGGSVMTCSYTRPRIYGPKFVDCFRLVGNDPQAKEGRRWVSIVFTPIKFSVIQ